LANGEVEINPKGFEGDLTTLIWSREWGHPQLAELGVAR